MKSVRDSPVSSGQRHLPSMFSDTQVRDISTLKESKMKLQVKQVLEQKRWTVIKVLGKFEGYCSFSVRQDQCLGMTSACLRPGPLETRAVTSHFCLTLRS